MTAAETVTAAKPPDPRRGERMQAQIVRRCDAWCEATGTPHTILALALSGNGALFSRKRDIKPETYDKCVAGLEVLARLDKAAGPLLQPSRLQGRDAAAAARKRNLRRRINELADGVHMRAALIALAVTHDSSLLHDRGGVSEAQFTAYSARLDRIEKAL